MRWVARGGKSGSAFHKTIDDRLIVKQMSRFEMESFLEVAYDYMNYVTDAVENNVRICSSYFEPVSTIMQFMPDMIVVGGGMVRSNAFRVDTSKHEHGVRMLVLSRMSYVFFYSDV